MAEAMAAAEGEAGAVAEGRRGRAMYHGHKSRGHGGWPGRTPCAQTARYAARPTTHTGAGGGGKWVARPSDEEVRRASSLPVV